MIDCGTALEWATGRRHGVLITNRKDGRSQSSDVVFNVDGDAIIISSTADRAKIKNIVRDPRILVHVSVPNEYSYISFGGVAELSPVCERPDDKTADALVSYYEQFHGTAHSDWDEYRASMVAEQRLVLTLTPVSSVGEIYDPSA